MSCLLDELAKENLLLKAAELRRKGFRPGCDDMSAKSAELWLTINSERLLAELRQGNYVPMPVMGFRTAKTDGGFRTLTRATAIDTVIQRCLLDVLSPHCEIRYSNGSYAFRPGRGVSAALQRYCNLGSAHRLAAKIDIRNCFSCIDYEILKKSLAEFLDDRALIRQLMRFAGIPIWEDGKLTIRDCGIPQGSPLGPLFCNIYLDKLDKHLEAMGTPFLRYGDDIVLFGNERKNMEDTRDDVLAFLREKAKMTTNSRKLVIDSPFRLTYLGNRFSVGKDGFLTIGIDESPPAAYHAWDSRSLRSQGRSVQIISDGILRQRDYTLLLETENGSMNIPSKNTECINIFSNVVFDSSFFKTAASHGIGVNLFDQHGHLLGRFLPHSPLNSLPLTLEQISAYTNKAKRMALARSFVLGSLHNLRLNIRYYHKSRPASCYTTSLEIIRDLERQIKCCEEYQALLLLEAKVRAAYFRCFDSFLAGSGFRFDRRSRQPPENEVNALLSFGNTILYSYLATEISKTALDVRIGFLHATNRRLESLNLDLAELFKPLIVDRTVFKLINRKQLQPERHFERLDGGGVYLSAEGKRVFLEAFHEKLYARVTDHSVVQSYAQLMTEEVRKLIRYFRSGEEYIPFRQIR